MLMPPKQPCTEHTVTLTAIIDHLLCMCCSSWQPLIKSYINNFILEGIKLFYRKHKGSFSGHL